MTGYALGLRLVAFFFRVPYLSSVLTTFSRIWLRHARWRAHLQAFAFDGVIDGGANIGEFAQVVRRTLPDAHLICVEPHPVCASYLRRQGFEVVQAALWNEKTKLNLFQSGSSTSSSVFDSTSGTQVAEVNAVRLCDLSIHGERLLVKLDLQGAELFALQGLGQLEQRCVAFLAEVSLPPNGNFEEMRRLFLAKGYVLFASVNELFNGDLQIEADILWIKADLLKPGGED